MDMTDLNQTISSLSNYALSSRTFTAYQTGAPSYKTFLMMSNLIFSMDSLPVMSEDVLMLYTAHCYKPLKLK